MIGGRGREVGLNDFDIAGITDDTNPVIPKDIANPPILEVFRKRG